MLSSKKLKPYIILGGILFLLTLNFAFWTFNSTTVQAAVDVPTVSNLSTRSLPNTAASIINAFVGLVGVIALGFFVYGGYLWMFSGGDPKKIDKAKKVLISTVIGLIIVLLSWAIVQFIFNATGGGGGGPPGGGGGGTLPDPSYVFKVTDYSPKGPDIPICRAIQATFDREYQSSSITSGAATGTFHLMKYCTDISQCNGIGLGDCDRSILGVIGTFCTDDIAGAFIYTDLNTVGFKPTAELEKMMDYKVLIDGGVDGVKSDSGAVCVGANDICKDWDFKTGDFSDKVPPQVLKVSPKDTAENVCRLKTIAAQFNEEMFKPSLTAAGAFSTTPAHNFSPSAPSFTVMRESPKNPYAANTDYYPLLNAYTIMDACFNKLDGNANGTAENSPIDDYGDPLPDEANPNWQFTTGETTQCVPKIDAISPSDSYYENPGNTLEITGENFDDIADTVIFNRGLAVGTTTAACFNASFTDTDQACLMASDWDGVSIPNKITINVPAGEGDSNGAITGAVKVKIGQFACDHGQRTCIEGSNKGLVCADNTQCPASSCGSGSCSGGSNAGNGCNADSECPGSESNAETLAVLSPHINNLSPASLGAGSAVGIFGRQFGNVSGTVYLIDGGGNRTPLILPCGDNSWSDSYIVGEIPLATPPDTYTIQIIRPDGRHSNLGDLIVNNDPPGPVLCPIDNFCSSGVPVNFTADGKRFKDDKTINDDVEFVDSGNTVDGNAFIADANIDWNDTQIVGDTPTLTDDNYSVRVALDKAATPRYSNSIPFEVPCSGRPDIVNSNSCPGSSPNPRPDSLNNCVNLNYASVRFTQNMDVGDLQNPAYISLWQCNTGPAFIGPCLASVLGTPSHFDYDLNTDEVRFTPTAALTQNTWYELRVSGSVRAAGPGLSMNADKTFQFHIRDNSAPCQADKIDVLPNSWTMSVPQTRLYIANALDSNTCNILTPSMSGWQSWISSNPGAATVTGVAISSDTATAVALGTTNISAFLDVGTGIPLTDTSPLTITSGGGGGSAANKCDNDNVYEAINGEECDGTDIGSCAVGAQECAKRISLCTCQSIPTITVTEWCKDSDSKAGKNTGITVKFSILMDPKSFKIDTGSGGTVSFKQGAAFVSGSLKVKNNATNTEVTFYPSAQLGDNLPYDFTIKGGAIGVLSKYGIQMAADSVSNFTTGTELCKIDKVTIILEKDFNPDSSIQDLKSYSGPDLFTCAGKNDCPDDVNPIADGQNQHNAITEARDANGILLSGINYSWSKSTDAPFKMLTPNTPSTFVQADPKSGIGALTVKADGGLAGIKTASTNITVMPCDNPWPDANYPFKDDFNYEDNINPSPNNETNFSLWYCRDAGAAGTADDLPALNMISKDGIGELIKEFFFYDAANPNDAIGLRVYNNYRKVDGKYYIVPAKEWYENRAPNRQGAPASAIVDGWDAVQAGRTIYVNAANHMANTSVPLSANIYLMSHSDKVSRNLLNILDQLKANWKFAITEYDDGTKGAGVGAPSNHVNKLKRDMLRRSNLFNAAVSFLQYRLSKSKYPDLPSGSYLPRHSTSIWPSWDQTLEKEIGKDLPIDPLNNLIIDQTGADKCLKANDYDLATCWNQSQTKFKCDTGSDFASSNYYIAADDDSHIYHYKADDGAKDLNLYAEMEYVGSDNATWRDGSYDPCGGVGNSSCRCYNYEQRQSVIEPFIISDMGLLGNGQWDYNLGEICDSSVTEGPNGLEGMKCQVGACDSQSVPAKIGQGCSGDADCRDATYTSGLCDFTPMCVNGNAHCPNGPVVVPVCKNGTVESPYEACDCTDFSDNPGSCIDGSGNPLTDYYYWKDLNGNDLNNTTISQPFDDTFSAPVECNPNNCRFELDSAGGAPTLARPGNGIFEPWAENCEPKKGYCSISQTVCDPSSNSSVCPGGETCIALGNGGSYCTGGSNIQCVKIGNEFTQYCPSGESTTSCMHTVSESGNEWENCGGASPPDYNTTGPYNYLQTDLWGWCFR